LRDLADVTITSPVAGQTLKYDGTKWVNVSTGGTPPSVVHFNYASANGAMTAVTMSAAPANGNLLVAIIYSVAVPTLSSGWTLIGGSYLQQTGLWYMHAAYKVAGASESTSQSPMTNSGGTYWTTGIWEVTGQNATTPILGAPSSYSSSAAIGQTVTLPSGANTLALMSVCPASFQNTTITAALGAATLNVNASGAAGAHAAYGWTDSNSPVYGFACVFSTSVYYDAAMILLTH
jgi:hypothetical protein